MLQVWLAGMLALGWFAAALLPAELMMILIGAGGFLLIVFGWTLSWQRSALRIQGGWLGFAVGWLLPIPSRWIRRMEIGALELITLSLIALELAALIHILIKTL
jgi:hypothetical protein